MNKHASAPRRDLAVALNARKATSAMNKKPPAPTSTADDAGRLPRSSTRRRGSLCSGARPRAPKIASQSEGGRTRRRTIGRSPRDCLRRGVALYTGASTSRPTIAAVHRNVTWSVARSRARRAGDAPVRRRIAGARSRRSRPRRGGAACSRARGAAGRARAARARLCSARPRAARDPARPREHRVAVHTGGVQERAARDGGVDWVTPAWREHEARLGRGAGRQRDRVPDARRLEAVLDGRVDAKEAAVACARSRQAARARQGTARGILDAVKGRVPHELAFFT